VQFSLQVFAEPNGQRQFLKTSSSEEVISPKYFKTQAFIKKTTEPNDGVSFTTD
jgi:hypothetical protein